ncbi:MAG: phosphatase PAP2 family protein [Fimbriimonadaceae bacterium]|nr:phosphatase PAP2 family protein [Fimbriimonadaceae bacterium]
MSLDETVFRAINHGPDWWSPFFVYLSDATKIWAGRIPILIVAGYLLWKKETRLITICAIIAVVLANELTDLLKAMYPMARPCGPVRLAMDRGVPLVEARQLAPEVIIRVTPLGSSGTASAHSANMMAVAAMYSLFRNRWQWFWLPVAILTGISRIYVGVHYPTQVMLGWACGIAMAVVVYATTTAIQKKINDSRRAESERDPTLQSDQMSQSDDHQP